MPRRQPGDGLSYPGMRNVRKSTRPGGKDSSAVGRYRRKTYVLEPGQIARVKALADDKGVGINALARWLLGRALDAVDNGAWELPIEDVTVKRLAIE